MQSNIKRIRKDFEPLSVAVSLVTLTPMSPTTQVYNSAIREFEPDRVVGTPTVILPQVCISVSDESFRNGEANDLLGSMTWKVNGKDITTLPDWNGLYSIETEGGNRGAITISRNVYPSERFELKFSGSIADPRLGVNVPILSDGITLSTHDKSEDETALSIGDDMVILYNPFLDKLLEYDYKAANGLVVVSESARNATKDANAFERVIPITVTQGKEPITDLGTMALKLYKIVSGVKREVTATDYEVLSFTNAAIKLDLRLIAKQDYLLQLEDRGAVRNAVQFSVGRVSPVIRGESVAGAAILPGDVYAYTKAMVSCNGNVVRYPQAVVDITWYTDGYDASKGTKTVRHNDGINAIIDLKAAGMGETYLDDWVDIYFECKQRDVMAPAADGTEVLTDESGNILII